MFPFAEVFKERLRSALCLLELPDAAAVVTQIADSRFGDYQSNAAMVLAKQQRVNPRELAARIVKALDVADLAEPPEVAGAGFINFRIKAEALANQLEHLSVDSHLGVPQANPKQCIVIDFSSPNVAKPMHVGHIRSTILGDSLARIARFLGHQVITDNHVGDWGTQFGKVIYGWKHFRDEEALLRARPVEELLRLYREVTALEAKDEAVRTSVREELVKLQQGDVENRAIWEKTVELSWHEFSRLYALLDVTFDERLGESFYKDYLAPLVDRLLVDGIAEMSEGAVCIFFRDVPELAETPCIIRKSDGGFLYATTDLATIEYRMNRWKPDAIWYVTGVPQTLHFKQFFAAARRIGWQINAQHIAFGSILGEDRKMMKTRSGENVQLGDVLDEAIARARKIVLEKNPTSSVAEVEELAKMIGVGAVKYAELSQHRMTDYVFSWDKMLSFQGNTAPYLQNAYVRIRSIFRKLESYSSEGSILETTVQGDRAEQGARESWRKAPFDLSTAEERTLALKLAQFSEVVPAVLEDYRPNLLANYLYEVAIAFHGFYEACPVLKAELIQRESRLRLSDLTARILREGLSLLGIRCPERM